jgi:hypothetical protein
MFINVSIHDVIEVDSRIISDYPIIMSITKWNDSLEISQWGRKHRFWIIVKYNIIKNLFNNGNHKKKRNKGIYPSDTWFLFIRREISSNYLCTLFINHKFQLPDDFIRRTTRKIPVLKRLEKRLQLASKLDGWRSTERNAEWYQDMILI